MKKNLNNFEILLDDSYIYCKMDKSIAPTFWVRLWRLITFPFKYLFKAELHL